MWQIRPALPPEWNIHLLGGSWLWSNSQRVAYTLLIDYSTSCQASPNWTTLSLCVLCCVLLSHLLLLSALCYLDTSLPFLLIYILCFILSLHCCLFSVFFSFLLFVTLNLFMPTQPLLLHSVHSSLSFYQHIKAHHTSCTATSLFIHSRPVGYLHAVRQLTPGCHKPHVPGDSGKVCLPPSCPSKLSKGVFDFSGILACLLCSFLLCQRLVYPVSPSPNFFLISSSIFGS